MAQPLTTPPKLAAFGLVVQRGGRTIVDVASLELAPGEVLAVIGPNGAGKSTLLLHLALLQRPDTGEVRFDGESTRGRELALRRRMAVVFQEALLLDRGVRANVETGLRLRGAPRSERQRRADQWLSRFGIGALAARSTRTLSGGEAQRVSLARALALEPEVLLLDEPFAALDRPARETITGDLAAVLAETRTATVLVTHDHDEAARLGHRVAVMMRGRIVQTGTPSEVFGAPADEEVAAFVGIETMIPARVISRSGGLVVLAAGGGAQTIDAIDSGGRPFDEALVCLRPEDISLARIGGDAATSARNRVAGRVRRIVATGADARVEIDCGFALTARVTRRSLDELDLDIGSEVSASFKATAVHLIPRA